MMNVWPNPAVTNVFWSGLRQYVKKKTGSAKKTGQLRSRITKTLKGKFPLMTDSANVYNPSQQPQSPLPDISRLSSEGRVELALKSMELCSSQEISQFVERLLKDRDTETLEDVVDKTFLNLAQKKGVNTYPKDYGSMSAKAMIKLQNNNKSNLLLKFAHIIAKERPGTTDSIMPLTRMPFGLIQYQIEFFFSVNTIKLKMPEDYKKWHQMMEIEFGTRFNKLFRGPAWSGCDQSDYHYSAKAKMNVAAVSHVTTTKENKKSPYHTSPEIQLAALAKLKETNPNGRFWIKLDATDIRPALQESVKGEWAGDCDLLDGKLQQLREVYVKRRAMIKEKNLDVMGISDQFREDSVFLKEKLDAAVKLYEAKVASKTCSQSKLKELNWEKVEIGTLLNKAMTLRDRYEGLTPGSHASVQVHSGLEKDLFAYLRDLFKKKRQPAASHVLVIMLSDERRVTKPYALPVQYVPYHSITDEMCRQLTSKIKQKMKETGLTCVGTVTDGEFSTLRTSGPSKEPLHTAALVKNSRAKVQYKAVSTLTNMIVKTGERDDGSPSTKVATPVPPEVINELDELQHSIPWIEALATIRKKLVPEGHSSVRWRQPLEEDEEDMLKSIIATYDYRVTVDQLQEAGRDFNTHFYVPIEDSITGEIHHEREDHNHVLKRLAKHLRDGHVPGVDFRRFHEGVKDGIISEAVLHGYRKQSVGDAEKLLSFAVADYLLSKGFGPEEHFVRIVARWHEASDGRGITQPSRADANRGMLEFIKKHWMPWNETRPGLKYLDINVRLDQICGFSRETILGVTTNIESQELRRMQNDSLCPEHPRAGTTDDVECFFALLHTITKGVHVTLKDFRFWWQKLIMQFINRIDPTLPFYVWTLSDRYSLDDQPSFDDIPEDEVDDAGNLLTRLHRLRHRSRELSSITQGGNTMPVAHSSSIRRDNFIRREERPSVPREVEISLQSIINNSEIRP